MDEFLDLVLQLDILLYIVAVVAVIEVILTWITPIWLCPQPPTPQLASKLGLEKHLKKYIDQTFLAVGCLISPGDSDSIGSKEEIFDVMEEIGFSAFSSLNPLSLTRTPRPGIAL